MKRLPGLDLLRAIAIVWVMLFHALGAGLQAPLRSFSALGWMGVDLFFVLSGFLIGSQLLKVISRGGELEIRKFYLSRAFRILPAYFVVIAIYFLLPVSRESNGIQPLWQFLSFTVNLFIDSFNSNTFSHAWSLCIEEHFYLLFPIVVWALMGRSGIGVILTLAFCVVVVGMYIRGNIWINDLSPIQDVQTGAGSFPQLYIEKIYYPTYTRLDGLLSGVLLATLKTYRAAQWDIILRYANWLLLIGLVGLGCSIAVFDNRFGFLGAVFGFPLLSLSLAFIVAAASCSSSILGKLTVPGASLTASLAYSLYLTHKSVFSFVDSRVGEQINQNGYLEFFTYSASAFFVAYLLYALVERPALRLRRKVLAVAPVKTARNAGRLS